MLPVLLFFLTLQVTPAVTPLDMLARTMEMAAPNVSENSYFSSFAKESLWWLSDQQKTKKLGIVLLTNISQTDLTNEDLMGSGPIAGQASIIVAQDRFLRFLREESANPQQLKNDFMIALVHETVHLRSPGRYTRNTFDQELQVWSEVNLKVVRPLIQSADPVNPRFIIVDQALRSCQDRLPCEPLRKLLSPRYAKH